MTVVERGAVAKLKSRNNKGIKDSRSREEGSGTRHWKEKKEQESNLTFNFLKEWLSDFDIEI